MKLGMMKRELIQRLEEVNIYTDNIAKDKSDGCFGYNLECSFRIEDGYLIKLYIIMKASGRFVLWYNLGYAYNSSKSIIICNNINAKLPVMCTYVDFSGMAKIVSHGKFNQAEAIFNDIIAINDNLLLREARDEFISLLESLDPLTDDNEYDVDNTNSDSDVTTIS